MDVNQQHIRPVADTYSRLRHQHPAWRLLASRRAPLVIACLKLLFDGGSERVTVDDVIELLATMLAEHANNPDYEINSADYTRLARRELRLHIKSKLLVERDGELSATDSLQQVFRFVERMEDRLMSSTASRLATVQYQIADVTSRLDPDPEIRAERIRRQIAELEEELARASDGDVEVLEGDAAVEAINEVYSLAISLHDDFGRVEDSYRAADQDLRVSIIRDQQHRGTVIDQLLEGHETLVETPEGKVFQAFYAQLNETDDLERMSRNLSDMLDSVAAQTALSRKQQTDLRRLRGRLVGESSNVVRARARSERDVRNYLRTGLGVEHQRVSQLLDQILEHALDVGWESQRVRRSPSPLPPIGPAVALPVPERLLIKDINIDEADALDFRSQSVDLDDVDNEFWHALDGLDRRELARQTVTVVAARGEPMTMAEIATVLPPTHDLETISVWVEMGHQSMASFDDTSETIDVETADDTAIRFRVPRVVFEPESLVGQGWEL
ncbi:MAG: DUF3375 domain-containing protein [Actinomycetia bacterium]|nr:DUF3375 domain-containing protein [Actinomycetes bacterium]MCP5033128.1 DUF3375 domain-containing protein [Actinomycetes bacterium]